MTGTFGCINATKTVDKCIDYFPKGKALIARRSGEIGGAGRKLSFGGAYNAVVEVLQDKTTPS